MRIRHLLLAVVALAIVPMGASRAQQTEIVIYHYQTDKRHDALKQVFRRFEAENADIKIVDIFKPDQTITSDVQAALAARRPVDIATIAGRNVYFMSRNTAAVPINQDAGKAAFLDNYLPQFLDVGRRGDKVFAMPYAFGTPMLYYNKDVFRKAGLDPEAPPKTWDEVIAAATTIQDKTGVAGVAHLAAGNKDYGTMLMVTNAGGTYLSAEGDKLMFDSPEGIAGLQLLAGSGGQAQGAAARQRCAMDRRFPWRPACDVRHLERRPAADGAAVARKVRARRGELPAVSRPQCAEGAEFGRDLHALRAGGATARSVAEVSRLHVAARDRQLLVARVAATCRS